MPDFPQKQSDAAHSLYINKTSLELKKMFYQVMKMQRQTVHQPVWRPWNQIVK